MSSPPPEHHGSVHSHMVHSEVSDVHRPHLSMIQQLIQRMGQKSHELKSANNQHGHPSVNQQQQAAELLYQQQHQHQHQPHQQQQQHNHNQHEEQLHHHVPEQILPLEGVDPSDNFVIHPVNVPNTSSPSGLNFTTYIYPTPQGNVTIYIGCVEYPLGKFHFYPSPRNPEETMDDIVLFETDSQIIKHEDQSYSSRHSKYPSLLSITEAMRREINPLCDGRAKTSDSARYYGCLLAMNAGFFDMGTGACLGDIVSDEQVINRALPDMQHHVHFALTRHSNYLIGYISPEEVSNGLDGGWHEMSQGNGWLVREGESYIRTAMKNEGLGQHFVEEKAPRNAIGHDKDGRLWLFEADGEEDINLGLDLYEFADILVKLGVQNAINLDGGGSSATVYKGEIVDHPTCDDTPRMCERAVTTISCVMP